MFDDTAFLSALEDTTRDFLEDDSISYESKIKLITILLTCCRDFFLS